ncbi:hypothetical protein ACFQJ5_13970 [Halomicroarcula sp. GCM10025324]|uniref:DUF7344 domain-containing protein n=1 Tax=Haloarcula TaxID=2237 RepID=UPI0023E7F571|nr:hypothetical protein [Halomicroarcula sp. ZS-22-S1]
MSIKHRATNLELSLASGVELSESERHRLLASERRCVTLVVLAERAPPVGLSDLAEAIAANDERVGGVDPDLVKSISIELHHRHLPKLDHLNLVDYVPETHRVEATRF